MSSSNISAFCPAFPPPTHAGLSLDRHIAICSRQSFAGLIFYPSRTANVNFPLYVHQTPSLSRRSRHPPAPVFRRPYLLSVPNGKHKLLPCINNISFILLSRHRPTAQLRFCRQHRISLAKALSFSPSLLLSFSPSLLLSFSLPPLSALFSRRFTINTCRLTSAASTVSNLKCQFQKLRRPYGQPTYLHPPADADVQTIKKRRYDQPPHSFFTHLSACQPIFPFSSNTRTTFTSPLPGFFGTKCRSPFLLRTRQLPSILLTISRVSVGVRQMPFTLFCFLPLKSVLMLRFEKLSISPFLIRNSKVLDTLAFVMVNVFVAILKNF